MARASHDRFGAWARYSPPHREAPPTTKETPVATPQKSPHQPKAPIATATVARLRNNGMRYTFVVADGDKITTHAQAYIITVEESGVISTENIEGRRQVIHRKNIIQVAEADSGKLLWPPMTVGAPTVP